MLEFGYVAGVQLLSEFVVRRRS